MRHVQVFPNAKEFQEFSEEGLCSKMLTTVSLCQAHCCGLLDLHLNAQCSETLLNKADARTLRKRTHKVQRLLETMHIQVSAQPARVFSLLVS